jgi:hypothetical protein
VAVATYCQLTGAGYRRAVSDAPEVLYHYTDATGLLGIFRKPVVLWASDCRFLNDAREVAYALDEFEKLLEREYPADDPDQRAALELLRTMSSDEQSTALRTGGRDVRRAYVADHLRSALAHLDPETLSGQEPFVACFCAQRDLLSQWRGYAAGGYAIGFRTEVLRQAADPNAAFHFDLFPVQYGIEGEATEAVKDRIARVIAELPWRRPRGPLGTVLVDALVRVFATIKDPAFSEEKEWRLVTTGWRGLMPPLNLRVAENGVLVPYIEHTVRDEALAEIVVGPGEHQELRVEGVHRLVRSTRLSSAVRVTKSDVPFR